MFTLNGGQAAPGRSCPLHYRYAPASFAAAAPLRCETLFIVGGLYGNLPALQQILALYAAEPGRDGVDKRLVFNGDFHWFDADAATFRQVNEAVLAHTALRGNVETEIADAGADAHADSSAGCGCAYPDWVGDGVVERSNRILQRLRATARADAAACARLAALPMTARVDVGPLRVAVVHGDAESLAGWGFAQEHLRQPAHRDTVGGWFDAAGVDAFACSHTCLPVFAALARAGREQPALVLNNGAAGMPNFRGDGAGLLTRIALRPFAGAPASRRHGLRWGEVHVDALAVDAATAAWRAHFDALWPAGSDARDSYGERIASGPDYGPEEALLQLS